MMLVLLIDHDQCGDSAATLYVKCWDASLRLQQKIPMSFIVFVSDSE